MKKVRKIFCTVISAALMLAALGTFHVNAETAEKEYLKAGYLLSMDNDEFLALDGAKEKYKEAYFEMVEFFEIINTIAQEQSAVGSDDKDEKELYEDLDEETRLDWGVRVFDGHFSILTHRNGMKKAINDLFSDVEFDYDVERIPDKDIRCDKTTLFGYVITIPSFESKYTSDEDIMDIAKINYCISQIDTDDEEGTIYNLYDCITIAKYIINPDLFDKNEMALYDYDEDGTIDLYDAISIAYTFM